MNKKELVAAIAESCGTTQAQAGEFVKIFCDTVTAELKQGDGHSVTIPGFGSIVAKHRPSREVRNPSTGKTMMSQAKTVAQFKAASALKDL